MQGNVFRSITIVTHKLLFKKIMCEQFYTILFFIDIYKKKFNLKMKMIVQKMYDKKVVDRHFQQF